jgi:sensor domain CHASE-containing protein
MIKFFRKIRQNLLSENKFSKYLLYAVGEIVLVIIGILIALAINQKNTDKNNNELRDLYLIQLNEEINENLKTIINHRDKAITMLTERYTPGKR